jgi:hypothetical protein
LWGDVSLRRAGPKRRDRGRMKEEKRVNRVRVEIERVVDR